MSAAGPSECPAARERADEAALTPSGRNGVHAARAGVGTERGGGETLGDGVSGLFDLRPSIVEAV